MPYLIYETYVNCFVHSLAGLGALQLKNPQLPPDVNVSLVARWQPALQPVWSDEQGCWCTSDHWVFRYEYTTGRLRKVFRLPRKQHGLLGGVKDFLARSWLRRRFMPGVGVDTLVQLAAGDLVLVYDQVYLYSPTQHRAVAQALPFSGQPALASPLRGGTAVHGQSQHVYFGEYLNGHQRDIRVARVDVARQCVEVCWTFSRSDIKHVHAIHYDRFRNRLWVCTGDLDHESAFWYTDDEFQTVHRFAGGDQTWRAIAMLFDETSMEWGMDAGKDAPADALNRAYHLDFATGQRTERCVIGNPAYAACPMGHDAAILQTTFEPGRPQETPASATLWHRCGDGPWRECFEVPYQEQTHCWSGRYGAILIPGGRSPQNQLLMTPVNTARHNGRMLKLSIQSAGAVS